MRLLRIFSLMICSAFFLFCFALPVFHLLKGGLESQILWTPSMWSIMSFTLFQALISTGISVLIGAPLGLWVSRNSSMYKWSSWLLALPFGVPTVAAGVAWISLLGRNAPLGFLEIFYSWKAVVLAHIFFNIPWIALLISEARNQIPRSEIEVAKSLGASSLKIALTIIRSRLQWPLLSAACQVFQFCVMSFALVLLLGGGPPVATLETSIYSHLRFGTVDLPAALSYGIWQFVLSFIPWMLMLFAQSRSKRILLPAEENFKQDRTRRCERLSLLFVCSLFLLPYFTPLFRIHHFSFTWSNELSNALSISLQLAIFSSLASVSLALIWIFSAQNSRRSLRYFVNIFATLPGSFSILALGLGFYLAYSEWINPFAGSFLALVILQTLVFLPIAFRWLWPTSLGHQQEIFEAALSLGASPLQAFLSTDWPRWRKPILSVTAMIAGASMGEMAAVSLFYSEQNMPLSLLISRYAQKYQFATSESLTIFLLFLCLSLLTLAFFILPKRNTSPLS